VEHTIEAMVAQRVFGIALGYEDLIDRDQLRHEPVLATLAGKLQASLGPDGHRPAADPADFLAARLHDRPLRIGEPAPTHYNSSSTVS
jgi:hypothetical protein